MKAPTYGTSTHYDGRAGAQYFDWQNTEGPLRGRINAGKFSGSIAPGDTVLDFGCGGGHLLRALECHRRIGVEVNPVALGEAASLGVEVFADVTEVPDGIIDVAVSNHALEHVPYPIEALRQIRRTLQPGGRLLLCVPIDDWRTQRRWQATDINHHLHTWTPLLLGNTLVEAGFAVSPSSITVLTRAWPPSWARLYRQSPATFEHLCRVWSVVRRRRQLLADVGVR